LKVVDAGVIVELVANDLDPDRLGGEELAVPHLIDSEVTNVLRRLVIRNALTERQAIAALEGFMLLALTRFPADWLRPRMWELRHNLGAYDATYVALAEMTGATALLTTDARLATAPGINCPVDVL
jgi:predicted nucleic acid-binding protein